MYFLYLIFFVIELFRIKVEYFFKNFIFIVKYILVRGLFEYFMSLNIYFRGNLCKIIIVELVIGLCGVV